ncbi:MAG: hypothetical protein RLZZ385_2303 [Pseudomonadota bacterium]|jgi:outer membrane receptor protein involved in Fe transport
MNNRSVIRYWPRLWVSFGATALLSGVSGFVAAQSGVDEIVVIGTTPTDVLGLPRNRIPYNVQSAGAGELRDALSLDLTDYLNSRLTSVSLNAAQNNPLQPDLQFRGFTASPLLGLPQGVSVYQNGVRINEPLGDAVNWDLLPESAVAGINLLSGANPLFGLNSLGGVITLQMKNGFSFTGSEAELSTGSWRRNVASVESGGNNGTWGYYVNVSHFDEQGWRDLSDSDALNLYGAVTWRGSAGSTLELATQLAGSELTGNGAAPIGLLALDRSAVFTAPDITENDLAMVSLSGSHYLRDDLLVSGVAYRRRNDTFSFNGDAADDDDDDDDDDHDDDDNAGMDDDADDMPSFPAVNNISDREQTSEGLDAQLTWLGDLAGRGNRFTAGYSFFDGRSRFDAVSEWSGLDPLTRSTAGLGSGLFIPDAATSIRTRTRTRSLYFSNTLDLTAALAMTLSGRLNESDVTLRDQSGLRPELNGDHRFRRFNPALGFTRQLGENLTAFLAYNEANRVPTPIELSCNESIFTAAQERALAAGEDPDDIEFECRLPNAFLADPPLDDVVTRNVEAGLRGRIQAMDFSLGLFNAVNRDDIIFQTTGRATGLFANVDKTRRRGLESTLAGNYQALDWFAAYTWLEATFEDGFDVLSPNHPQADADGELPVEAGDAIPGIPRHQVKLGAELGVSPRLRVAVDGAWFSGQTVRGDEANLLDRLDSYGVLNLRLTYAYSDSLLAFVRVTNLLDSDYESFGLLGEDPDEVVDFLVDDRPLFLGAGAPRGAWLGVRFSF